MATAIIGVKNPGNIDTTYYIGLSTGRGVSGTRRNIGLNEEIYPLPLSDWGSITLSPSDSGIVEISGIPDATVGDEYCVVKLYSQRNPDPAYCYDGAYAKMPLAAVYAGQIISFEVTL